MFCLKKQPKHKDNDIFRMMLPSFVGIVVCAMCLVGLTFAWFTATVETKPQVIITTTWNAEVKIVDSNAEEVDPIQSSKDSYDLSEGKYTVTVTASGSGSGYCKLTVGDDEYYTAQIGSGTFTFDLELSADANIDVTTWWGIHAGEADVENGGVLMVEVASSNDDGVPGDGATKDPEQDGAHGSEDVTNDTTVTSETIPDPAVTSDDTLPKAYIVKKGDTLGDIAAMFGTTTEKLVAYNSIKNPSKIEAGQVLLIPPADYEIPDETTEPAETETTAPETTAPAPDTTPETTVPDPDETTAGTEPAETAPSESEPQPEDTTGPVETESDEPVETEPEETTES